MSSSGDTICNECQTPLGVDGCNHMILLDGYLVVKKETWEKLVGELTKLKTLTTNLEEIVDAFEPPELKSPWT